MQINPTYSLAMVDDNVYRLIRAALLAWPGQLVSGTSLIVRLRSGVEEPLFFIGCTAQLKELNAHLEQQVPLYGLKSDFGIVSQTKVNIVQLATRYVSELDAFRPFGPFSLVAYCGDSLLAWEIARQLILQKREVAFLALIEADIWFHRSPLLAIGRSLGKYYYHRHQCRELSIWGRSAYVLNVGRQAVRKLVRRGSSEEKKDEATPPELDYAFTPIRSKLKLFYVDGDSFLSYYRYRIFQRSWGNLALNGFDVQIVPGSDHTHISWAAVAAALAAELKAQTRVIA